MKKNIFRYFYLVLFLFIAIPVFGQTDVNADQNKSLKTFKSVLEKHSHINPKNFKSCEIEYKYYPASGRFPLSNMSNYPGNDRVEVDRNLSNQEKQSIREYHNYTNSKLVGFPSVQKSYTLNLATLDSNKTEVTQLDNKKYVLLYENKREMKPFDYTINYFLLDVKSKEKAEQVQNALIQAIKACEQN